MINTYGSNDLIYFVGMGLIDNTTMLAGGALRSLFDYGVISDFDLFFKYPTAAWIAKDRLLAENFKVTFQCPEGKLTTLKKEPCYEIPAGMKVQLITERWYYDPKELIDTFDINACRMAYDGQNITTCYSSIRDATKKKINLHAVSYPAATMKRIAKYIQKGYTLQNGAVDTFINTVYDAGLEHRELDRRFYID